MSELDLKAGELPTGMWVDGGIFFFTEAEAINAKPAVPGSEGDPAAIQWAPKTVAPSGPQLVAQNLDSVYLSVYTDLEVGKSERMVALRAVAKGRGDGDPVYLWGTDPRTGLGRTYQVTWARPPYALRLELPEVASISVTRRPYAQSPQCRVEIRAAALWQYGAAVIIPEIIAMLASWQAPGAAPPRVEVSRVDIAADFMDLGLTGRELFDQRWLTRARYRDIEAASSTESKAAKAARKAKARKKATADRGSRVVYRGTHYAGSTFGKGDLVCAIYDKTREVRDRGGSKAWMHKIWAAGGWDGISPVWRVEVRLRKDALKAMAATSKRLTKIGDEGGEQPPEWAREWAAGCVTVGNALTSVMRAIGGIWRYMTGEWITLRDPVESDKRRSRWPVSALWKAVQAVRWSPVVGVACAEVEVSRARALPREEDKTGTGSAAPAAFQLRLDGDVDPILEIQRPSAVVAFGDGIIREHTAEQLRMYADGIGIRLDVQSAEARRDLLLPGLLGTLAAWDAAATVAARDAEEDDGGLGAVRRALVLLDEAVMRDPDAIIEYMKRRRRARQKASYRGAVRLRMSLAHHPGRGVDDDPQSWRPDSSTAAFTGAA